MLISNSRFRRRGPSLHRPEGQVIQTDAELAGERSVGAAGSPHRARGEHVQRLAGSAMCGSLHPPVTCLSCPELHPGNP